MKKPGQTIFIAVTRGFIVRNILRSGTLEALVSAGHKAVIFFPEGENAEAAALSAEFTSTSVAVEFLPKDKGYGKIKNGLYRLFKKFAPYLVYSDTTWAYSQIGNTDKMKRNIFWAYLEKYVYGALKHVHFLKTLSRWIESQYFYEPIYAAFFEKYQPNLFFSTSIISKQDVQFMKEAKRRGIPSVAMPKGWDNISKMLFRVVPDVLVLQNGVMKEDSIKIQRVPEKKIAVCGFPQFDWYRRPEILLSREALFQKLGLSPDGRLIFFGSEGTWAPQDDMIAEKLCELVNTPGAFAKPCALLIRPHFSDINNRRFDRFRGIPNVKVDDNYTLSNYFNDNWNPSLAETKLFVNCLFHSDVMVTTASTLVLDAACFDKPLVGISYGVLFSKTGKDVSSELYETDHFKAVNATKALDLVYSHEELRASINRGLENPAALRAEREHLLEKLCYKVDGKSSQRIAETLMNALQE